MSPAVADVFLVAGAALGALAGLGQLRFEDLFVRMHLATKPATLGLLLVGIGAAGRIGGWAAAVLILLNVVIQFLTAPVGAHLVGRAAHRRLAERDDAGGPEG